MVPVCLFVSTPNNHEMIHFSMTGTELIKHGDHIKVLKILSLIS